MGCNNYMKKIQDISNIVKDAKCPNDILKNENINLEPDFQYICLNSGSNYDVFLDVIAKMAKDDKGKIIENNVKLISMNTWKDLYCKNDAIKKIFIDYFDDVLANTSSLSCTEVEELLNDKDVSNLVYVYIDDIINKLSTGDRASLITALNERKEGPAIIKQNLPEFFKKGQFGISTTYSRILKKLDAVKGISKLDVLRACNDNLSSMIKRATAFDNENKILLDWIYDAFEESKTDEVEAGYLKSKIDNAILKNFDNILEKVNYDKETIRALKQFECTRDLFEKNKSEFIDKSAQADKAKYDFDVEEIKNEKRGFTIAECVAEQFKGLKVGDIIQSTENNKVNEDVSTKEDNKFETQKYELSNELIDTYLNKQNTEKIESNEKINEEEALKSKLESLIINNIRETDKIIEKVVSKKESTTYVNNKIELPKVEEDVQKTYEAIEKDENNDSDSINETMEEPKSMVLVGTKTEKIFSKAFFKKVIKKVLKIFGFKRKTEHIGE